MVSTIPQDELQKHAANVYEAIVLIAKRARQINDEQKRLIDLETGYDEANEQVAGDELDEEMDEIVEERAPENTKFLRLPKPTTIALEELLSDKLEYRYSQAEEENS
jgi:DNA-directed RNA polymerase subunit K/omega